METPKHTPHEPEPTTPGPTAPADPLDEALDESFPASDPVPGPAIALPSPAKPRR